MEHSYTRDWKPTANSDMMATRTILVERPPLCPSCHQLPPNHDEKVETPETYNIPIPIPYDEEAGRRALDITEEMIKSCHNRNSDSDDWTQSIQKFNWTDQQLNLFERVERILDMDQLGRLAVTGLSNECLRRNAIIEKSVSRMRAAFGSVHWDLRLTSWLHGLLMTHLPSNYMVSYIDILRTLKRKLPVLVDKILYHKPFEMHKDYMSAIMKRIWEPVMVTKTRTLPSNPVIVIVSSFVGLPNSSSREKRWMELLSTLTSVQVSNVNLQVIDAQKQIEQVTEQLITMTRAKIQEIRNQIPNRHIILAGCNAGAAIALQVALVETVNSIVCLGFAFNTLFGVHGEPDDRILDLTTPVLFVIGQNAQRSSQEEIESLRDRMCAQTQLVVVGSSDDALRVKRFNRSMEGVSQSMIDNMIMDEIQEFATSCILNPPGPRKPKHLNGHRKAPKKRVQPIENGYPVKRMRLKSNPKFKPTNGMAKITRVNHIHNGDIHNGDIATDSDDVFVQIDFENVLPTNDHRNGNDAPPPECNGSPSIRRKIKYIPANRFVHLEPPPINTQKLYKQQNGNESYTLGVKNIGTTDIPVIHNKLITVKHKEQIEQPMVTLSNSTDETDEECAENPEPQIDRATNIENIFDFPILFDDYDGNMLENQTNADTSTPVEPQPLSPEQKPSKSIEIISEEIITDAIIGNEFMFDEQNDNEQKTVDTEIENSLSSPSKVLTCSGKFVVLNRNTLSRMKTVKSIPAGKLKKIIIPSKGSITAAGAAVTTTNHSLSSSLSSKTPSLHAGVKTNGSRFQSFKRLTTPQNHVAITNGRPKSPKSNIIIKRNHLKNFTIRKVSVVQSKGDDRETAKPENNNDILDKTDVTSTNDSKDSSLNSLIADLEN